MFQTEWNKTGGYADERHMGRYQGIFCERLDAGREGAGNLMLHHVGSDQGILSGADQERDQLRQ